MILSALDGFWILSYFSNFSNCICIFICSGGGVMVDMIFAFSYRLYIVSYA